jgi:phosphonate transport system permease protein
MSPTSTARVGAGSGSAVRRPPERDPAWIGRLWWALAVLVLLWPLGVATEFRPWVFFERDNLKVTGQFLASFWPLGRVPGDGGT